MDEAMHAAFGDLRGGELVEAQMAAARQHWPDATEDQLREQFGLLFAANAATRSHTRPSPHVDVPAGMELLIWYLVRDGYLVQQPPQNVMEGPFALGGIPLHQRYVLTESGQTFVDEWSSANTISELGR